MGHYRSAANAPPSNAPSSTVKRCMIRVDMKLPGA
jgi:hypothetical protein